MSNHIQLRLRKQWAVAVLVFIAYQLLSLPSALAQAKESKSEGRSLRLVLSLDRHVIYAGESVTASVVVENRGAADALLRRDIHNGTDIFSLYLRHDQYVDGPVSHLAGDNFYTAKPSLANLLSRKWLLLGDDMFYGKGSKEEFHSYRDEVAELPFKPWEGRLESNSIWIEVK